MAKRKGRKKGKKKEGQVVFPINFTLIDVLIVKDLMDICDYEVVIGIEGGEYTVKAQYDRKKREFWIHYATVPLVTIYEIYKRKTQKKTVTNDVKDQIRLKLHNLVTVTAVQKAEKGMTNRGRLRAIQIKKASKAAHANIRKAASSAFDEPLF